MPWEIIGNLTSSAARDCGLVEGIPIAAGCGDQAAGTFGAGLVEPGRVLDGAGTASVFTICTDRYVPDVEHKALFTAHLVVPGLWYALAYINGGGLNLRWFRDELAEAERLPRPFRIEKHLCFVGRDGGPCSGGVRFFDVSAASGRTCLPQRG